MLVAGIEGHKPLVGCLPASLIVNPPRGKDCQAVENAFSTGVGVCVSVYVCVYTYTHVCVCVTRHAQ